MYQQKPGHKFTSPLHHLVLDAPYFKTFENWCLGNVIKTMVYYYTVGGGNMPKKVATCQEEDSKREHEKCSRTFDKVDYTCGHLCECLSFGQRYKISPN